MKKKLLTVLFVALMVCLFALTVNAANEVTLTDGTTVDFETVFKINSKNQVTGFNSDYNKDMVTDVIFPDEIEGLESNFLFNKSTSIVSLIFAATDEFFISGDNIFSGCSVQTIRFNPDCIVEIRKGNFVDCTSLTSITFPKFRKLSGSSFKGCSNMKATNELVLAEGMTDIGGHAFNGCTSLSGTVYFPSTLETIQEYSFQNTGFTNFDLSKCANLTAVGGGYGGPFTNSDKITTLDLSACVKLKDLKGSFVADSDNLTNVILPPNLENIPHKAFAHCYKLQSIVFPASMKTVADEAFHSARGGQTIKTFTIYLQSNVVFHNPYAFRDSSAKIEFVLIGDGVTAETFKAANTFSTVVNATVVDYKASYDYTVGEALTSHTIVENYCKALAINGEHTYNYTNPCVVDCTVCKIATVKENPEHTEVCDIVYANGYTMAGVKITSCANEGCPHNVEEPVKALLICLGYSASQITNSEISLNYKLNNEAFVEYATMGNEISCGLFAATTALGDENVIDENGAPVGGAVVAKLPYNSYVTVTIKMTGFNSSELKAAKFAHGVYIAVKNDGVTKYSYIQASAPKENEKYSYVSYNDVVQMTPQE